MKNHALLIAAIAAFSVFVTGAHAAPPSQEDFAVCSRILDPNTQPQAIIDACTRLIEGDVVQQDRALAFAHRSTGYVRQRNLQQALSDVNSAIALNPNWVGFLSDRAFIYGMLQQFDKALADLNKAARMDPKQYKLFRLRAEVHDAMGNPDLAIADLTTALVLEPNNAEMLNSRCWLRAQLGRELDKALADCEAALRINPRYAAALDSRGFVHFRMQAYAKAIADAGQSLANLESDSPHRASPLYVRGLAKLRTGDEAGGRADIAAAKAIEPDVAERYGKMGVTP